VQLKQRRLRASSISLRLESFIETARFNLPKIRKFNRTGPGFNRPKIRFFSVLPEAPAKRVSLESHAQPHPQAPDASGKASRKKPKTLQHVTNVKHMTNVATRYNTLQHATTRYNK
jgi:hypothetical protein